jgi:hypothetical protein
MSDKIAPYVAFGKLLNEVTRRMCRLLVYALFADLLSASASGQTSTNRPAFSVVSVKRVPVGPSANEETETSVRYPSISLRNLVLRAYELQYYQLADSPLLGNVTDHYEIFAKLPDGSG